jgi:pyridinium-3,5-bisthiocarboxylic acid mononucleotide nickel chelatase
VLETNIDDMSPELMGYTMERLLKSGALDVFYTPVYMKKNRPAAMLTVLSTLDNEDKLVEIILKETSTLGIRRTICGRYCMERESAKVKTDFGEVRVKIASSGDIRKMSPEYEDCREIADRTGIPLRTVYEMVYERSKNIIS